MKNCLMKFILTILSVFVIMINLDIVRNLSLQTKNIRFAHRPCSNENNCDECSQENEFKKCNSNICYCCQIGDKCISQK